MDEYQGHRATPMHDLLEMLRTAMYLESIPNALATLLAIAEDLIHSGDKTRAFEVLVLVLQYHMQDSLRMEAEYLHDELEFQLCPRVVADARARAEVITLDDMVTELMGLDHG